MNRLTPVSRTNPLAPAGRRQAVRRLTPSAAFARAARLAAEFLAVMIVSATLIVTLTEIAKAFARASA